MIKNGTETTTAEDEIGDSSNYFRPDGLISDLRSAYPVNKPLEIISWRDPGDILSVPYISQDGSFLAPSTFEKGSGEGAEGAPKAGVTYPTRLAPEEPIPTLSTYFDVPAMAGFAASEANSAIMNGISANMANQTREGLGPSGHNVMQETTASMQTSTMSTYSGIAAAAIAGGSLFGPEGAIVGGLVGLGIDAVGIASASQEDAMVNTTSGNMIPS